MANLKFYKHKDQPQSATAGSIWFNTTLKTIEVYNGTTWEKFAGKLVDANWNTSTQKLTINKADGSSIDLDFSNIASLSGVQAALSTLETRLQGNIDTVAQAAATADGKAVDAQQAADAEAQRADAAEKALGLRIDGVAADIATEATNRQTEDNKLAGRISTLESTITGLNGTLHFRGVTDTEPTDPKQGDFYITTAGVEWIYDGKKWEKIGDTSAESASIAALEGRMTTAEGDIDANAAAIEALQTRAGQIEAKDNAQDAEIAKKAVKTEVEASISGLQGQITSNDNDITALQGRAEALEGRMGDAEDEIGTINQTLETLATAESLEALEARVAGVETKSANNETEIGKTNTALNNYKTEVSSTYATKTSLASTEAKAEQNKKDIAALGTRVTTAEGKITTAEGDISTLKTDVAARVKTSDYNTKMKALEKADSDNAAAIEAVEGRATALEAAIERLDGEQDVQDKAISDEVARAKAAEGTLTTNLNAEITRAKKAEGDNATAIATETTNRQNADAALDGRLTTAEADIDKLEGRATALETWKNSLDVVDKLQGDNYISASSATGDVKLIVNATTAVTKDSAALVTSGAVATAIESALEWEEFK